MEQDEDLLALFRARAEDAIVLLRERYGRLCRSVAAHILPDERDAEECLNDVCLKVWNAIPPEQPDSMPAYLARVTRNLALDRYDYNHAAKRDSALTEAYEELETCLPLGNGGADATEQEILEKELRRVLNAFLSRQPQEARVFFLRRYWYGERIAEIAEENGVSEEKVKTSLFRTRKRLKAVLEKEGIVL